MSPSEGLQFHRLALQELREARDWYDARSADAGAKFRVAAISAIERIASDGETCAIAFGSFRYVRLSKFPYTINFARNESHFRIVAVAHTNRRFGYWRRRK